MQIFSDTIVEEASGSSVPCLLDAALATFANFDVAWHYLRRIGSMLYARCVSSILVPCMVQSAGSDVSGNDDSDSAREPHTNRVGE